MTTTNGLKDGNVTQASLPIVIAGGGCVGLFLALLLTQSAIPNRVIVIEPLFPDATSTRAMAHQPNVFPLFERAGVMKDLVEAGSFSKGLCFRTSVRNGSKFIAGKVFQEGEKAQLLLPQGKLQEILVQKVEGSGKGEVRWGWRVTDFNEQQAERKTENTVRVQLHDEEGERPEVIDAVYLIGADGARSFVRKKLGLSFEGETLSAALVATDIVHDFHKHGFYDANFVVDQHDYGLIGRIDTKGLWRVSYGVSADTSEEEIRRGVEGKLRKMIPGEGANGFEVKRVAPYKAQQRCVDQFWRGQVGVCGDAAHVTVPYAGLGLASGIADASSLAPILIRIVTSQAMDAEKLLSSWSSARRQKFLATVDKPSRAAYARIMKKVDTEEDINEMLRNDELAGSLKKGMPVMPPSLETKVNELEGW